MDALTAALHAAMPLVALLGVEGVRADADEAVVRLPWRPDLCTLGGVLHGGALMALADATGAWCATHHLPPGAGTATTSSTTQFLRAARGDVVATARALHVGRTSVVVDVEVRDGDGRLVARTTQAQAVLQPRP